MSKVPVSLAHTGIFRQICKQMILKTGWYYYMHREASWLCFIWIMMMYLPSQFVVFHIKQDWPWETELFIPQDNNALNFHTDQHLRLSKSFTNVNPLSINVRHSLRQVLITSVSQSSSKASKERSNHLICKVTQPIRAQSENKRVLTLRSAAKLSPFHRFWWLLY